MVSKLQVNSSAISVYKQNLLEVLVPRIVQVREILSSAITTSSSSPLPWPAVNNEKPKGFSLFCTTLKSACMWETANKLAHRLAQTKHCYISRIRYTQTGRCRECKKFSLCFVAKGSANFLWMISRCSFHPFFLLSSLEPPTHSLLLTFLTLTPLMKPVPRLPLLAPLYSMNPPPLLYSVCMLSTLLYFLHIF